MGIFGALAAPIASWAMKQTFGNRRSGAERVAASRVGQRVDALDALGGQYGQDADHYRQRAAADESQSDSALQSYLDELTRPRTMESDATLARAGEGIGQDRERASSRLASNLARSGVSDSSAAVGGQAAIENAAAGRMAAFRDDVARREVDRAEKNRGIIVSVLAKRLASNRGAENTALARQVGIEGSLLGQERQDQGIARQDAAQSDAGIGSIASIIGQVLARRRGNSGTPQPAPAGGYVPEIRG